MTKLNKALMASSAMALACGLAFPASAQDPAAAPGVVSSGQPGKMKVKLYGQIAKVFGVVGDGNAETFKVGENGNTQTRMGLDSRGKINSDVSVRTRMEFGILSGDTGGGSQFVNQGGSASRLSVRHLDLIISSKKFGAVWIGRGDTASNGTAEQESIGAISSARLGGTTALLINNYDVLSKSPAGGGPRTNLGTIGHWFDWMDGANRMNRIRYDTPSFFGFKAGASFIDKHNFDLALHYAGKIAGTKVKGAVGYCHTVGSQTSGSGTCFGNGSTIHAITQIDGSVSVLTPIGVRLAFSGGNKWRDLRGSGHSTMNNSAWNITPSVAYVTKVNSLGDTIADFAFEYCKYCNTHDMKNSDGKGYALTLEQMIDNVGGDYFVTFRYFDVSTGDMGVKTEGLWFFGGGFRQRF